jgi:hypothetical protein
LLLALAHFALRRRPRDALVVGAAVVSHWFLDALVHRPDLPLYPGDSPMLGLGLWNSVPGTLLLELSLFAAGVWLYLRATRARDATGRWATRGLVAALLVIYLGNVFGPPPPGVEAIAWVGQAQWLLVAWAGWADAHREAVLRHSGSRVIAPGTARPG